MHWCFHCYGVNAQAQGACVHCGQWIEAPRGESFEQRLIWALEHPDGDRAILAARTLGVRRVREAIPGLRRLVTAGKDPYLAREALRSVIAIEGVDPLREWLLDVAAGESSMLSAVARAALDLKT